VQVDPIKPASKPTGPKRSKLRDDELLSNVAFITNLRRYTEALAMPGLVPRAQAGEREGATSPWKRSGRVSRAFRQPSDDSAPRVKFDGGLGLENSFDEDNDNSARRSASGLQTLSGSSDLATFSGAGAGPGARGGGGGGEGAGLAGRGLHSFPFQLNFSSSVHRMTQLNS